MNPQFQNMMGMGRGMPNGNMQQMNANNTSMQLQRYILQTLQGEGPWTGWQAEVQLQERVMQIKQLVDSLRLLGPPVELQRAVDVALNFERKEFAGQPTKEDYQRECADKLSKIRDQRQQHMRQLSMANGQNMGMMTPNFQQQMQMRTSMPPQMNVGMQSSTMSAQNQTMPQMQSMNPAQNMGQMNTMNQLNQMNQMAGNMQQISNQAAAPPTGEENFMINQRAADLAKGTEKDEMRTIVSKMDPRLRSHLAQKGIDPIIYHFRMLATKEFRQQQMLGKNAGQNQTNNNMSNAMGNNMGNGMGNMGQMPNAQQNNVNASLMKNTAQPNAAPFMNIHNQFQNQQEAGWKSQQEGQQVVPASNNQSMTPDQLRLQQQQLANQRVNQPTPQNDRNFLLQQQQMMKQQQQQAQQQRQLQAAQAHVQAQNQARAQAAAGQGNMPNTSQPNATMNMLNRPVGPGMPNGSPQPSRPQSRAPMPGQQPQIGPSPVQTQIMQNPQAVLARLPPGLQGFLRTKPTTEWAMIIQRWQQQQQQQQQHQLQQQQGQQMPRTASQQPGQQTPQQPNQQMPNMQMLGAGPVPMQQSQSGGPPGNMPTPDVRNAMPNVGQQQQQTPQNQAMLQNAELLKQRQMQLQQQQQQQRLANGQAPPNNPDMSRRQLNQQETAIMDMQVIHPHVLRQLQPVLASSNTFVPDFKNWQQLKQWLMQNPQPKVPMQNVISMQTNQYHFQVKLKQQAANAAPHVPGGGPVQQQQAQAPQQLPQQSVQQSLPLQQAQQGQPAQPAQQAQQPVFQQQQQPPQSQQQQNMQQNMQPNVGPTQNMVPGQMRPITDQDILKIRQSNPKVANMTDDQIRQFMMNRLRMQQQIYIQQQQQMKAQAAQSMAPQPALSLGQNTNQKNAQMPNQQAQASVQPPSAPTQQQSQPQMPAMNRTQSTKAPSQQPNQQVHPFSSQQTNQQSQPNLVQQKSLKRPNQDESVEPPVLNQNNNQQASAEPPRPSMRQMTKEEFEKLSDADKQKYMNMVKMRQRQELQRRINEFSKQVLATTPQPRPIVNMDPGSKKRIVTYLTSDATKNMLNRFEPFLVAYCHIENNEPTIKQLMSNRNLLVAQYKQKSVADKTWEPADHFSISADNVESMINNMSTKFQQTMAKQTQRAQTHQNQQPQGQPGQPQPAGQQQQQQASQQPQQQLPLTVENLNLVQAQQASQQAKKGQKSKDIPPAAPIATQPPFQIGDNRGQGTPRYAPNASLKQEDLKLDPNKRRKKDGGIITTPTAIAASPHVQQEQKSIPRPFKCGFSNCEYQITGFASRDELDHHIKNAHRLEMEPVTDPLAFFDSSLMQAFDLDAQFRANKKVELPVPTELPMQKSISKAGSNLKMESKPSTPIPMARGHSQQMSKLNAPATPSMLKTPQSVKAEPKALTPKPSETTDDLSLWTNSNFSLDTLRDTFGDMDWNNVMPTADPDQFHLEECIQTYMQSEEWQKVMDDGTLPNSSDGSTDKSKSPGEGSEQSAAGAADAQKQGNGSKQVTEIDLSIDGINISTDGFEDLIMSDSQMQEVDDHSWERVEKPSPDNDLDFGIPDPFASLDDPEMDAWSKPLYEPLQANGFPESTSPFEPIDLDEFVAMNGPEVWAAGSMEWNAVGVAGEKARRDLGWPIEGAHGLKK